MAGRSWNRVELIGNLTRDPELRYTPSGAAVCTFSVAVNRAFVSEGEKKEEVDFFRVVAWNKLAEVCAKFMKKGNKVFVSGRLQNRSWETPDGQTRQTTEMVLGDMVLLTPKNGTSGSSDEFTEDVSPPAPPAGKLSAKSEPKTQEEEVVPKEEKASMPKEDPGNLDDLPF